MTNSTAGIFRKIIKYQNLSNMHMADMLIRKTKCPILKTVGVVFRRKGVPINNQFDRLYFWRRYLNSKFKVIRTCLIYVSLTCEANNFLSCKQQDVSSVQKEYPLGSRMQPLLFNISIYNQIFLRKTRLIKKMISFYTPSRIMLFDLKIQVNVILQ